MLLILLIIKKYLWIADYVLMSYGTGAIMAVPGHDERDNEFANKFNLPITFVVKDKINSIDEKPFFGNGYCINSDFLNDMSTKDAINKVIKWLEDKSIGKRYTNYRLRDWLISRQRYWGTPIPIVYDPDGNPHCIPKKYLPWKLPDDVEYKPKGTSPLGSSKELIERTEKIFGKGWRPEVDTMDTFVCSSWYYLRYLDSKNNDKPFNQKILNWMPVDCYVGGAEHATMHLLYARFITKALRDMNYINFDEPFKKLYHQGTITKDGAKMSKSKGNTVAPDKFIEKYGSDTFRIYLMFMGPYNEGGDWNDKGIKGIHRFLKKVWKVIHLPETNEIDKKCEHLLNKTIKIVTENLNQMVFNTSISRLMELVNLLIQKDKIDKITKENLTLILAPFAPHFSEELWSLISHKESIFDKSWPSYDKLKLEEDSVKIIVQVNGKLRASFDAPKNSSKEEIFNKAKSIEKIDNYLKDSLVLKEIYVPNKLINFVIKPN